MEWNEPLYVEGSGPEREDRRPAAPRLRRVAALAPGTGPAPCGRRATPSRFPCWPGTAALPRTWKPPAGPSGRPTPSRPTSGCGPAPTRCSSAACRWAARWRSGWPSSIPRWPAWSPSTPSSGIRWRRSCCSSGGFGIPRWVKAVGNDSMERAWTRRPTSASRCAPRTSWRCSPGRCARASGRITCPALLLLLHGGPRGAAGQPAGDLRAPSGRADKTFVELDDCYHLATMDRGQGAGLHRDPGVHRRPHCTTRAGCGRTRGASPAELRGRRRAGATRCPGGRPRPGRWPSARRRTRTASAC